MCVSQRITCRPYLGNGERYRDTAKALIITPKKCHTLCQTKWKSLTLDDIEGVTRYCG